MSMEFTDLDAKNVRESDTVFTVRINLPVGNAEVQVSVSITELGTRVKNAVEMVYVNMEFEKKGVNNVVV